MLCAWVILNIDLSYIHVYTYIIRSNTLIFQELYYCLMSIDVSYSMRCCLCYIMTFTITNLYNKQRYFNVWNKIQFHICVYTIQPITLHWHVSLIKTLLSHNIMDFIQLNYKTILKILHVKIMYVINCGY